MPLLPGSLLAPNFSAHELGADNAEATDDIVAHLGQVAAWLQTARGLLGVPLVVDSGFRDPAHNASVGGVPDSEHLTGYAADFTPTGLSKWEAYQKLSAAQAAGQLPPFDELVYYVGDSHIHVGVRPTFRGHIQVKTTEGSYLALTEELASQLWGSLPGSPPPVVGGGCCR